MQYDADFDVPFLADALADLARLNMRHFAGNIDLMRRIMQGLIGGRYRWVVEKPDVWRDAVSCDEGSPDIDCEDASALVGPILALLYGKARVGIRKSNPTLCHAIAGDDRGVIDVCPLLGMPGISSGFVEWRELEAPNGVNMLNAAGALLVEGFQAFIEKAREKVQTTGASDENKTEEIDDIAGGGEYLLQSLIPVIGAEKVKQLQAQAKRMQTQYDAEHKKRLAVEKTNLECSKKLVEANKKILSLNLALAACTRDKTKSVADGKAQVANVISAAEERVRRATSDAKEASNEQLTNAQNARVSAEALVQELREQLAQMRASIPSTDTDKLSRIDEAEKQLDGATDELSTQFEQNPDDYGAAWDMVQTGAAFLGQMSGEKAPCCDACASGKACTGATCGGHSEEHHNGVPSSERGTGAAPVGIVSGAFEMPGDDDFGEFPRLSSTGCGKCQA